MALTSLALEKAKPKEKPYKLTDGDGLHLLINPNGSKLWRFRYQFCRKEKMLSFGSFPEVSLAQAREKRTDARKLVAGGADPSQQRREDKVHAAIAQKNTFGALADEYIENLKEKGSAAESIEKNKWLLHDLASTLADRPVSEIKPAEILDILKKIEKSGRRETARRLRGTIGSVFRLAVSTLRAEADPTYALRGALLAPTVTHRPAITDETDLGALLVCLDEYDGWPTLKAALQFLILTMGRPGEVRLMRRNEVVWPKATWRVPAERMKMRRPHDVPLTRQALDVLRSVWERRSMPSEFSPRGSMSAL
jgi:integrase